jgi:hypothetical protein
MIKRLAVLLALVSAGPALAAPPAECLVAQHQVEQIFPLPHVSQAVAAKKLNILVVGSASSTLPGSSGVKDAYPARLQTTLSETLPDVAMKVIVDARPQRTAEAMLKTLKAELTAAKPALMIWQTGTVDAMQGVDPDQFSATLVQGIVMARAAGADVILINPQYSPRTESMIALATYTSDMRWVAVQHDVPLFDRFEIMKVWADLGTFDLSAAANKLEVAGRVHNCIGWLLSELIIGTVKSGAPHTGTQKVDVN